MFCFKEEKTAQFCKNFYALADCFFFFYSDGGIFAGDFVKVPYRTAYGMLMNDCFLTEDVPCSFKHR